MGKSTVLHKIKTPQINNRLSNTQQIVIHHLESRLKYFKALLDYSPDIIVAGDTEGRIVEFNKGAEKLLGYKRDEVIETLKDCQAGLNYMLGDARIPNTNGAFVKLVEHVEEMNGDVIDNKMKLAVNEERWKWLKWAAIIGVTGGIAGWADGLDIPNLIMTIFKNVF